MYLNPEALGGVLTEDSVPENEAMAFTHPEQLDAVILGIHPGSKVDALARTEEIKHHLMFSNGKWSPLPSFNCFYEAARRVSEMKSVEFCLKHWIQVGFQCPVASAAQAKVRNSLKRALEDFYFLVFLVCFTSSHSLLWKQIELSKIL